MNHIHTFESFLNEGHNSKINEGDLFDVLPGMEQEVIYNALAKRVHSVNPNELATLIYTSGTTGAPKGVMLNQTGWITAISHTVERMHLEAEDSGISLLPPWHAFERALEYAIVTSGLDFVVTDAKVLKEDLALFHPTVFPSVPRLLNKVYDKI